MSDVEYLQKRKDAENIAVAEYLISWNRGKTPLDSKIAGVVTIAGCRRVVIWMEPWFAESQISSISRHVI